MMRRLECFLFALLTVALMAPGVRAEAPAPAAKLRALYVGSSRCGSSLPPPSRQSSSPAGSAARVHGRAARGRAGGGHGV